MKKTLLFFARTLKYAGLTKSAIKMIYSYLWGDKNARDKDHNICTANMTKYKSLQWIRKESVKCTFAYLQKHTGGAL